MLGLRHEYTRALWHCEVKTYIPSEIQEQCKFLAGIIEQVMKEPNTYYWRWHICHIIQHLHDFCAYDDASLGVGAGGHSMDLGFWYQLFWRDIGAEFADWVLTPLNKGLPTDAHINWLEYMATSVCLAGSVVTYHYRIKTGEAPAIGMGTFLQHQW
jgi:hypothetical protein